MGTTEECFSKEMDIIERMANRILDELSDSNKISLGGALRTPNRLCEKTQKSDGFQQKAGSY